MVAWKCNERGFSLLELMVALAIFGAAMGVLLAAHTAASRHEAQARNLFTAAALLRDALATSELEGVLEVGEEEGDFGDDFEGYRWRRTVTDAPLDVLLAEALGGMDAEELGVVIPAGLTGIFQVRTAIQWEERGFSREVSALYYAVAP